MGAKAIYPGTFDPPTNGHIDIIERAWRIFGVDNLTIVIGINPKKTPLFTPDERKEMLEELIPKGVRVFFWDKMMVSAACQLDANVIIRGFRALSDFEAEFQMAHINKRLEPNVETILIPTSEDTTFYSSSLAKELASIGAPMVHVVPPLVEKKLREKYKKAP